MPPLVKGRGRRQRDKKATLSRLPAPREFGYWAESARAAAMTSHTGKHPSPAARVTHVPRLTKVWRVPTRMPPASCHSGFSGRPRALTTQVPSRAPVPPGKASGPCQDTGVGRGPKNRLFGRSKMSRGKAPLSRPLGGTQPRGNGVASFCPYGTDKNNHTEPFLAFIVA